MLSRDVIFSSLFSSTRDPRLCEYKNFKTPITINALASKYSDYPPDATIHNDSKRLPDSSIFVPLSLRSFPASTRHTQCR